MNSEYFPTDYVADTMKEHMQRERVAREEAKAEGDDKKRRNDEQNDDKETINSTM